MSAHSKAVELREFLFRLGVGARVNYGGSYGFQNPHQAVATELNEAASRLVGAIAAKASKKQLVYLFKELEGNIKIAAATEILSMNDANKALGMLDTIRTDIK
jgi:hypothetical protein